MRARGSKPWPVCCRPARLDRHLHMGEAGGKTGAGTWEFRSGMQRKQTNSRMRGERRPRKHISVHAGRGRGQGWEGTKIMNEKESESKSEGACSEREGEWRGGGGGGGGGGDIIN